MRNFVTMWNVDQVQEADMLEACMHAKGYQIRKLTHGEAVCSLIILPIFIPCQLFYGVFMGADLFDFY